MAKKVQVLLVDDVDKLPADETVSFSLDGVSYEIDLTSRTPRAARRPRRVDRSRRAHRRSPRHGAHRGQGSSRKGDLGAVRAWARENGHKVSDRGRISADVQAAYDKAHA